jgi:hypothetical protein
MNRFKPIINEWLKEFPDVILTDEEYKDLEKKIDQFGSDQFSDGCDCGYCNAIKSI